MVLEKTLESPLDCNPRLPFQHSLRLQRRGIDLALGGHGQEAGIADAQAWLVGRKIELVVFTQNLLGSAARWAIKHDG